MNNNTSNLLLSDAIPDDGKTIEIKWVQGNLDLE